jgi:hypothetical protein
MTNHKKNLLNCLKTTLEILDDPRREALVKKMFLDGEFEGFRNNLRETIAVLKIDKNIH